MNRRSFFGRVFGVVAGFVGGGAVAKAAPSVTTGSVTGTGTTFSTAAIVTETPLPTITYGEFKRQLLAEAKSLADAPTFDIAGFEWEAGHLKDGKFVADVPVKFFPPGTLQFPKSEGSP